MSLRESAQRRLAAILTELDHIEQSDFPYEDSRLTLARVRQHVEGHVETLSRLHDKSSPEVVKMACQTALRCAVEYLPIVGFLLRSTNVRNAFELYRPLRRLARQLLQSDDTRLILSSEWKLSPFTYTKVSAFPLDALIGFPATESANPLITPLAGHEIGHYVWQRGDLAEIYKRRAAQCVEDLVKADVQQFCDVFGLKSLDANTIGTDLEAQSHWGPAASMALRQSEEMFCDLLALRTFGAAYAHAFSYLLAPMFPGNRRPTYPSMITRASVLREAAKDWTIAIPDTFVDEFQDQQPHSVTAQDKFRVGLADRALSTLVPELLKSVEAAFSASGVLAPSAAEAARIRSSFEKLIPPQNIRSLADVINAAWIAANDPELWKERRFAKDKQKILAELVLKTVEVLDYEQTLGSTNDAAR